MNIPFINLFMHIYSAPIQQFYTKFRSTELAQLIKTIDTSLPPSDNNFRKKLVSAAKKIEKNK